MLSFYPTIIAVSPSPSPQLCPPPSWWSILTGWFWQVTRPKGEAPCNRTFLMAAHLMDRISKHRGEEIPALQLQCVGAACLLAAGKFIQDSRILYDAELLTHLSGGAFTLKQLLQEERCLLRDLDWSLDFPQLNDFDIIHRISTDQLGTIVQTDFFRWHHPEDLAFLIGQVLDCSDYSQLQGGARQLIYEMERVCPGILNGAV